MRMRGQGEIGRGIGGMAGALLSGLFPYIINTLIDLYDWRSTYVILGAALIFIMVPVGWVFVRDRPEEYSLKPDGWRSTGRGRRLCAPPPFGW